MRQTVFFLAVFFVCVTLLSPVKSQTASQQQSTATPPPAAGVAVPTPPAAGTNVAIDQKQVSYALGQQFAMNMKANEIPCDMPSLFAGISDVLTGAKPKYTDAQLNATMRRFMQEMQQKGRARMQAMVAKNKKEENDFLAKNKARPGVQTTASGLQYKVVKAGNGPSPTLSDTVRCNYRGVLLDGTEFDSSEAQGGPQTFPVNRVIPGWTEALQKMRIGDKWELYVPAALAYDMEPPGEPIEPGSMLIFEIELLGINGQ